MELGTAALHRSCSMASLLNLISEEFFTKSQIRVAGARNQHYQPTGSHIKYLQTKVGRLVKSMENVNLDFLDSEKVYNIVSKAILRSDILDVLEHEEIGKQLYTDFTGLRSRREKSVWEPMQKRNLKTFKFMTLELQEEKSLIWKYLIASRKKPDLDIQFLVGNFEFSVVPKYYSH